jgi:hypothetical protein
MNNPYFKDVRIGIFMPIDICDVTDEWKYRSDTTK